MSDLNDLSRPVTTDTEPSVLDTLRAHVIRAATWSGWASTVNKVAGIMSATTAAVTGGRSLRLYRRNDANTADEEVVSLPGISVGGNAATASAAQSGSTLESALAAKAPLNNAALTGVPTAPTAAAGTSTTQLATTAFVAQANAALVGSAPEALNTLNEFAAALGNDPNFATSTATAIGNRVVKTSSNRPGVTKLYSKDIDADYSVQTTWQADKTGYWSLRGYSGDTYHAPVYVGYAGYADTAGSAPASDVYTWAKQATKPSYSWSEIASRPTALSSFTNDSGYQTASGSVSYATTAGNGGVNSVNGKTGVIQSVTTGITIASTSGSSIDFTSIPSWVKRIVVSFNGVSTNGASPIIFQLGTSGGIQTTGYSSTGYCIGSSYGVTTAGLKPDNAIAATDFRQGIYTFTMVGSNIWVMTGTGTLTNLTLITTGTGSVSLGSVLTTLRVTTLGGTDAFDAGTMSVLYE